MDISKNELILIEFLAQVSESTKESFECLLRQFPKNETLQKEFKKFYELFVKTMEVEGF